MLQRFLLAYINKDNLKTLRVVEPTRMSLEINEMLLDKNVFKQKSFSQVADDKLIFYRFKQDTPDNDVMDFSYLENDYIAATMKIMDEDSTYSHMWEYIEHVAEDIDAGIRFCVQLNEMYEKAEYSSPTEDRYVVIYINQDNLKCLRVARSNKLSAEITEKEVPQVFENKTPYGILDQNSMAIHLVKPGEEESLLMSDIYPSVQICHW